MSNLVTKEEFVKGVQTLPAFQEALSYLPAEGATIEEAIAIGMIVAGREVSKDAALDMTKLAKAVAIIAESFLEDADMSEPLEIFRKEV